jgi:type IV fimbrial biogenesis protein FimT
MRSRSTGGSGFTLVELLVVIVIAAVLAVIAIPSWQNFVLSNRGDTASNQFAAVLSMARSEAVKQGATVWVCISAAPLPCVPSSANITNWTGGWNVCCAPGTVAAASYVPVQRGAALTAPMTSYGTTPTISFDSLGRLPVGSTAQSFFFCPDGVDPNKGYLVTVQPSGRVRVVSPQNGQAPLNDAGLPETACNAPL